FSVDLAAIESAPALFVAEDFIGLTGRRELVLRLRIIGILVRMILLGELAIRRFYFLGRCGLGNAQHFIWIAHACACRIFRMSNASYMRMARKKFQRRERPLKLISRGRLERQHPP